MSNNNEHPNTPKTSDIVTRALAHRRIDSTCIAGVAKLCAKMLTESEACRLLGIRPRAWFDWKSRCGRTEKFAALLEAFRADRLNSLIEQIEAGAKGVNMKQPDWRAAAHLLAVTGDKARFGPQAEATPPPQSGNTLTDETMTKLLAMLRAGNAKPVIDVPDSEPKQIENAKP
jgi:hypothetical protein